MGDCVAFRLLWFGPLSALFFFVLAICSPISRRSSTNAPHINIKIAVELAERLRAIIEAHVFNFESNSIKQTVSIGVCQQSPHHEGVPQFMEDVDKKLYDSKHNGRNRVSY